MANRSKRHIHKYHRIELSYGKVWACALPDCNHHMPQYMDSMVPGKNSLCWNCNEKMVLNPLNMKNDKPLCSDCVVNEVDLDGLSEAMKQRLEQKTG